MRILVDFDLIVPIDQQFCLQGVYLRYSVSGSVSCNRHIDKANLGSFLLVRRDRFIQERFTSCTLSTCPVGLSDPTNYPLQFSFLTTTINSGRRGETRSV